VLQDLNPTYTVESIAALLKELEEWEGFVEDLFFRCADGAWRICYALKIEDPLEVVAIAQSLAAKILTTGALFAQAATAYLREVGK
jgi:hypothetical protein